MSAQDLAVVIGACSGGIVSIIGAIFSGWILLRQNPKHTAEVKAEVTKLHDCVNEMREEVKKP